MAAEATSAAPAGNGLKSQRRAKARVLQQRFAEYLFGVLNTGQGLFEPQF